MGEHAPISPSDQSWPYCAGSIREQSKYPDVSGDAAIDGTGSHLLLENCVVEDVRPLHYVGTYIGTNHEDKPTGWLVESERCDRVMICLDYIERRKEELRKDFGPDCEINVQAESKSNPGVYFDRDDWWGTCDITITVSLPTTGLIVFLEVIDYKDGRGYVSEKWNGQLIDYLFGKLTEDIKPGSHVPSMSMRMTIIQPKTGTPIRYMCSNNPDHGLDRESLISKINWRNEQAKKTDDPDAQLVSGDHCSWCDHNPKRGGTCTTSTEKSMEVIETMTNDLSILNNDSGFLEVLLNAVSDVKSITPENLAKIADIESGFFAVFDKVKGEIKERIVSGVEVPGYAMVPGRASKKWNEDEDVIFKKLKAKKMKKDQIYPAKLISPAAVLKHPDLTDVQKKSIMKNLISEVVGQDTLQKVAYDHKAIKDTTEIFKDVPVDVKPLPLIMTDKAAGATYQQYVEAGWTDEQMIEHGYATGAVETISFL